MATRVLLLLCMFFFLLQVRAHEGEDLALRVRGSNGNTRSLTIVPQQWSGGGEGLLGLFFLIFFFSYYCLFF